MRTPVYICGPYAAANAKGIRRNVARAVALGRLATERGFVPVIPHASGFLGAHGDPLERDDGTTRARALDCGVSLARLVAEGDGVLLVILRDDQTESFGTSLETDAGLRGVSGHQRMTWRQWCVEHPELSDWSLRIEARLAGFLP